MVESSSVKWDILSVSILSPLTPLKCNVLNLPLGVSTIFHAKDSYRHCTGSFKSLEDKVCLLLRKGKFVKKYMQVSWE